jgi:predicted nucleotidyltransferase
MLGCSRKKGTKGVKDSTLQRIVNTYRDYLGDALFSMVLFGSHARGEAKETSDYDLLIIAKGLPAKPVKRRLFIRAPLKGQFDERFSIVAKTPEEMRDHFPSFFLDLGVDGIIVFDRGDFFKKLQVVIREIIKKAGLQRKRWNDEFYWEWQTPPKRGWEITWNGYRALS